MTCHVTAKPSLVTHSTEHIRTSYCRCMPAMATLGKLSFSNRTSGLAEELFCGRA